MLTQPHHIVAIGASAGGIAELELFFDHTPLDGICYVIIQHLSQDIKSHMAQLLSRHSSLTVTEATQGATLKRNYVYLIPNDKLMTVTAGQLQLKPRKKTTTAQLTIDLFLTSLAADCGKKAIAVILSGLGSDGTAGIKAIKEAGGMVIARNPAQAEFDSMPASAISTGMVHLILEPQYMPRAIEAYVQQGQMGNTAAVEDKKTLSQIITLIGSHLPLDFSEYKENTISRRITRRMAMGNFANMESYLSNLHTSPSEIKALAQDFLISVTAFFRDKEAYQQLQTVVIPELLAQLAPDGEIKVWVAGCATGEEAYSMAMLICEQLNGPYQNITAKIFATDIDSQALQHAAKGIYDISQAKDLSNERLKRFFSTDASRMIVKPELRKMVIFAQHDLARNPPYCNLQLISCRNLLIYMTPVLQKKVFAMLHFGLKLGGYLFLGSSENPLPIIDKLEVCSKKYKIYKNIKIDRNPRFDSFAMPDLFETVTAPIASPSQLTERASTGNLSEAVNLALSSEQGLLVICIDQQHQVVKTYGDTTRYLLQKNFTPHLAELLPRPLAVAFNNLYLQVAKTGKAAKIVGLKSGTSKSAESVDLSVSPLAYKKGENLFYMVTLGKSNATEQNHAIPFDEQLYHDQYILNLEDELRTSREELRGAHERLDSTNENMQSFNEELLSANEEMQSTNEEMQSINEELQTINTDYQAKNRELLELNDDLNNYFRSNINGQLFVNYQLQLVKFSPGAVKLINLRDGDIGRPLADITTNIKLHTIIEDIKEVLEKGTVIHREIQTNEDKWYQLSTMPYLKDSDQLQTGAILTFNDITALKSTQQELDRRNKTLGRINEDLDHFIHAASHDLLAPLGNIELSIGVMNHMALSDKKLLDYINVIGASIKKFSALIKDIATIAQIENDTVPETVDLAELLENIRWSLEERIKSTAATITTDLEVATIAFSKKNLRSILYNLVSNGIKFKGEQPPVVHIQVKKEEGYTVLSVQDNGKGIRKQDFDKIFDLYGRLNQNVEGHGIGLYLTKKIINASGGNLVVESEVGKGSRFIIYFRDVS